MKRSNSLKDKKEPKRWTRIHIWKQEKAGQQQEALCMHRFCCWCARHDLAKARGFHVRLGWFSETAWPSNSCVVPMKKPKKLLQMDGRYVANTSDKDLGLKRCKQAVLATCVLQSIAKSDTSEWRTRGQRHEGMDYLSIPTTSVVKVVVIDGTSVLELANAHAHIRKKKRCNLMLATRHA